MTVFGISARGVCAAAGAAALALALGAGSILAQEQAPAPQAPALQQDTRTLLVVDDAQVPRWMFDNALRDKLGQAQAQGRTVDDALRRELAAGVLDNLIQMELLAAEARRRGVQASPQAGELRAGIVAAQSGSEQEFAARLAKAGMTREQYVVLWQQQASVNRLVEEVIQPGITLSEVELRARYMRDRDQLVVPPRVRVAEVFLPLGAPGQPAGADLRARALAALAQARVALEAGEGDFLPRAEALARELDADFPGATARELGWVLSSRGESGIPREVRQGAAGFLGQPVGSKRGAHLHAVLEAQPRRTAEFGEVREEMAAQMREERTPAAIEALIRQLRERAAVQVLMDVP
ncbi:SurA N-terminal domain-containing protein [Desulfocurvus vexinensis]|uniref:SurA N-terminal domain-containing protein n=1 Tax=Desulfocurvus vexinensis TaxID=399548 RepID=UPI00048E1FE5|nr:SurA N-terminal domain-containing protein [Desulfocurvus vexinensis]